MFVSLFPYWLQSFSIGFFIAAPSFFVTPYPVLFAIVLWILWYISYEYILDIFLFALPPDPNYSLGYPFLVVLVGSILGWVTVKWSLGGEGLMGSPWKRLESLTFIYITMFIAEIIPLWLYVWLRTPNLWIGILSSWLVYMLIIVAGYVFTNRIIRYEYDIATAEKFKEKTGLSTPNALYDRFMTYGTLITLFYLFSALQYISIWASSFAFPTGELYTVIIIAFVTIIYDVFFTFVARERNLPKKGKPTQEQLNFYNKV